MREGTLNESGSTTGTLNKSGSTTYYYCSLCLCGECMRENCKHRRVEGARVQLFGGVAASSAEVERKVCSCSLMWGGCSTAEMEQSMFLPR